MSAASSAPRLAVIGHGRMGRVVESLARERAWRIAAVIRGARDDANGVSITPATLNGAQVAIEFTRPEAAVANVVACVEAGCPIVVGTTGWLDALPEVTKHVERADGAMLWAPNFSLGVAIFLEIVARASTLLARAPGFDAHLIEMHHTAKRDAPSGTALALRQAAEPLGRDLPITSVRVGHVPGTHTLIADAPFEQLRLEHTARDRRAFAEGALVAAQWLIGRRGVFTLRDLLNATGADA